MSQLIQDHSKKVTSHFDLIWNKQCLHWCKSILVSWLGTPRETLQIPGCWVWYSPIVFFQTVESLASKGFRHHFVLSFLNVFFPAWVSSEDAFSYNFHPVLVLFSSNMREPPISLLPLSTSVISSNLVIVSKTPSRCLSHHPDHFSVSRLDPELILEGHWPGLPSVTSTTPHTGVEYSIPTWAIGALDGQAWR